MHMRASKVLGLYRRLVSTYPAAAQPGLRKQLEMAVAMLASEEPPPGDFMEHCEKLLDGAELMFVSAGLEEN